MDGQSRAPHAPRCGHVFCLRHVIQSEPYSARSRLSLPSCIDHRSPSRCLKSLTRRVCPMCRNPFQPSEVTKIHLDQRARSSSATSSPKVASPSPSDPGTRLARELHDRINSFVQTGASTSVAHTLTEDCKTFFQENASTDVRNNPPFHPVVKCFNVDDDISSIKIFTSRTSSSTTSFLVITGPFSRILHRRTSRFTNSRRKFRLTTGLGKPSTEG